VTASEKVVWAEGLVTFQNLYSHATVWQEYVSRLRWTEDWVRLLTKLLRGVAACDYAIQCYETKPTR